MGFASSARSIPLMTNLAALPIVVQILDLFLAWFFFSSSATKASKDDQRHTMAR